MMESEMGVIIKQQESTEVVLAEMKGPVVVTGASGYIGSWLVMKLLQEGYGVRATVRDPKDIKKTEPLLNLCRTIGVDDDLLSIWRADLCEEGSFDEVINGSTAVFHVATPMHFEAEDPENEVIRPTVEGVLNVMRSCKKAKSVDRVTFTSSAGTVNVQEQQMTFYDENCWSDVDYITRVKMTGWMYFLSKIKAEKAAWDFAMENDMDLITTIPPLVVGPFLTSSMPPSMNTALSLITGSIDHYSILKQVQLVHLDDLCRAHIFLMEHPGANGRYICSSDDATIFQLAKMIREGYPDYGNIPTTPCSFQGIDEDISHAHFSSERLLSLGFKFKYTMKEMVYGAIDCCREKKLIPLKTIGHSPIDDPREESDGFDQVAAANLEN